MFDIPVRVVDTAGFEEVRGQDDKQLRQRSLNKQLLQDMMRQTRNALIYSDLALFLMDSRKGITYNDVALYKWLIYHKLRLPHELRQSQERSLTEEEKYERIMRAEAKYKHMSKDAQFQAEADDGPNIPSFDLDVQGLKRD